MTTIGSLFTGMGGLDHAVSALTGAQVAWTSDISPGANKVIAHHWPDIPNLGDITKIDWDGMKRTGNRKLLPDQVESAVEMYRMGMSLAPIAQYFDVTRQAMWDLLRRRTEMRPQTRTGDSNNFYRGGTRADQRAHDIVEKAVRAGRLTSPENCETCGGTGRQFRDGRNPIQAHHCDYNKPLDVMWLCQPCHHAWHQTNTAIPVTGGDANGSLGDVDIITGGFP